MSMGDLKLITLNARGIKNKNKRKALFSFFKQNKYDIICLQETHITKEAADGWERKWGGKLLYTAGTERSRGEIILIAKHLSDNITVAKTCDRITVATVKVHNLCFTLINVYAPNDTASKLAFLNKLSDIIKTTDNQVLIMGDMNTVLSNDSDIVSGNPHNKQEVERFRQVVEDNNLCDVWRCMNGDTKEYTWSRNKPPTARRLDYCLVSEELLPSCV
ncbi:hypothetical protein BaRGS_00022454 [Batillaria attramentaria]|uniref:exodeoxyribonuclease III n=1 Tax=Batillaria attramentaria TaxID=370345 RepID=A0ABD0KGR3_9CAEN